MSAAPSLFDVVLEARERVVAADRKKRDAGEGSASSHLRRLSPAAYGEIVRKAETYAGSGVPFTSDAIRRAISQPTEEQLKAAPNAIGAVFAQLCRAGILERTGGSAPATHAGARGRRLPLWVGTAKARGV